MKHAPKHAGIAALALALLLSGCGQTAGQPGFAAYCAQQNAKLKKYRRGLPPGPEADAVDALILELEERSCL